MATMISSYPSPTYQQQYYNYSALPSVYSSAPVQNNYYVPPATIQPTSMVQYANLSTSTIRPRRQPRVYRQVIMLPTPEPIYRQVRHRLPTPDRQVFQRTVVQKANGDVIVQQEQLKGNTRNYSRSGVRTQSRPSRLRQIYTD